MVVDKVPIYSNICFNKDGEPEVYCYSWQKRVTLKEDKIERDYPNKKATNPPRMTEITVGYHDSSLFFEDGWFVIPIQYLGEGIESGLQYRELVGTLDPEI